MSKKYDLVTWQEPSGIDAAHVELLAQAIKDYLGILNSILQRLVESYGVRESVSEEDDPAPSALMAPTLTILVQGIGTSASTILALTERPSMSVRDCYGIARSLIESSVNTCLLLSRGDELAEQAIMHARQFEYRAADSSSKIGSSYYRIATRGLPAVDEVPGLAEAIAKFSSKKGKPLPWVDLSVPQRIGEIEANLSKKAARVLHLAYQFVYAQASEVLHGSFYGHVFIGRGPTHQSEYSQRIWNEHRLSSLYGCLMAVDGLIEGFGVAYGYVWATEQSARAFEEFSTGMLSLGIARVGDVGGDTVVEGAEPATKE